MNQRPLSAAYEGMTSKELAAAAFAHADNELESLRIKAGIPWKTYSMMDAQFIDALEHLHLMGYLWANDYWSPKSCGRSTNQRKCPKKKIFQNIILPSEYVSCRAST